MSRDRRGGHDRGRSTELSNNTNSDDPVLKYSRVFIGNLPTDSMTKEDLVNKFKPYGTILGKKRWDGVKGVSPSLRNEYWYCCCKATDLSKCMNSMQWNSCFILQGVMGNMKDSDCLVLMEIVLGYCEKYKWNLNSLENFKLYFSLPLSCLGATLLRGYGFVQYGNEEDAQRACQEENGGLYKSYKIGKENVLNIIRIN